MIQSDTNNEVAPENAKKKILLIFPHNNKNRFLSAAVLQHLCKLAETFLIKQTQHLDSTLC